MISGLFSLVFRWVDNLRSMMQKVMGQIVADVAEDAAAEDGDGDVPVPVEDKVGEAVEGGGEHDEEGGWHDEAEFVHGEVVVDAVEEEMQGYADAVVREVPDG